MRRVILETPYKGDDWKETRENLRFARLCMRDCLIRGEAALASHLLYTQPGILNDKVSQERRLGIEAGFAWKTAADATVVYINRGISEGMLLGVRKAIIEGQKVEYRNLATYAKKWRPIIITITGASGVGKTTIAKRFLEMMPCAKLVTSFTTRSPRPSDLPGEYEYNMPEEELKRRRDEFLWVVSVHGNLYGTSKKSVMGALALSSAADSWLMMLTPEVIPQLRKYISGLEGDKRRIAPFYVLSPSDEELRKRLSARGDDEGTVQKRINDCKKWDRDAIQSDIPYIFLTNNEPTTGVEKAIRQMLVFC